ncbi:hypothetical protein [Streptomyces tubercidicus]|uniref:hypothetical protein n=1 Tax=Streptomyces tubercidicus TaxID=47759 RepID=UPI0034667360
MPDHRDDYDAVPLRPVTNDEIDALPVLDLDDAPNPPYDLPVDAASWSDWCGA